MTPLELILLLVAAGIVLLIGELLLPTHGLLGLLGLFAIVAAMVVVFQINRWLGVAVFVGAIVISPFLFNGALKIWAKSPIGKRVILQPIETQLRQVGIELGEQGVAVTELRPIGECDFGERRLEAASELGIIRAGQTVKVVAVENGRPIVRAIESPAKSSVEQKTG